LYGSEPTLLALVIGPAQVQTQISGVIERTSLLPWGAVWFEFFRTPQGKLLRFPQLADFDFDPDDFSQGIRATPSPDVDRDTIEHLFHNNVVPMLTADGGALILHGAAVDIGGFAVIFLGASGRGKSTLAASFAAAGFPFLSDDSVRLSQTESGYRAEPSYPSIRLWRDSDEAVLSGRAREMSGVKFSNKARYAAGGEIPHSINPTQLRAIYVLANEAPASVMIQSLGANAAMMEFVQHSFILDLQSETTLGGHFERMATLANKMPVFRLDYPRDYTRLPDVRAAIVSHARALN
jgi:hypothetical protein